jgi:NTP pyrophosphatase (non-canonical NTP hydrolase)
MDGEKPEGWATELADCIIRIMDVCEFYNVDLEKILVEKMRYNETRPYRHGKKL